MKTLAVAVLLLCAGTASADTIPLGQICKELNAGAVIPLAPGVANDLSRNLLDAQAAAYYTLFEPESLQLSINAVLRAISIYVWDGGPTLITSEKEEPIVWQQSRIAIDTRVSAVLDPTAIDFGEVAVVTPEPGTILLLLAGLGYMLTLTKVRQRHA